MITDPEALAAWKQRATQQAQGRVVLDLEADSLHRYHEKLCLIQYADQEGVLVIDPLAIENMRLFSDWLQETEVWMHGADYDMNLFQNAYEVLPKMIWDTQIAARLLGFKQFGLAALVEHFYGIVMSKKNQKADWGKRPITPSMEEYAQADVQYMLDMSDKLVAQLNSLGRFSWFVECCQQSLEKGRERFHQHTHDSWRIKGSGKLNRRGLAALKVLWLWRDKEAALWDKPCFMVCSNDELMRWSIALQEFRSILPRRSFHEHRAKRMMKEVDRFLAMDEEYYPKRTPKTRRKTCEHFDTRLEHWTAKRDVCAADLGIEASFILSRQQLEHIAEDEASAFAHLMQWQRELLQG